ncbi:low molecular weight protein arginine phosphatase [Siminovitchia sp. FSL H7-0308]|uniref:Protein-tyrosine phosphatase n=1 Tax=Siminovitchia thermophila TaxID=1245522 RepID=A0ABS2R507_9BACI|nr:low molecular weight protein arginine phosphatase [Siminovitchia thermophila]MBM7714485.1 protein-tyrosine phosphatase [Siminovitchia thermophila]ONK25077.1 low molecular weight phosphatase family protein [Bacillus sp. VT-16-64]
MNILFVCTGNTCRSPMAEAIFHHIWNGKADARSAGLFAAEGSKAADHALKVLKENNMKLEHRSKQLQEEDIHWAKYVFTMTEGHKQMLMDMFPAAADKIFTLKEYVNGRNGDLDVIDPFGGDLEVYRSTFQELRGLIARLSIDC